MDLPFDFPDFHEEAARRAREFQRLPADERLRQLMDVIGTGLLLLRDSPHFQSSERLFRAREAEWQRIQRDLIRRHGS